MPSVLASAVVLVLATEYVRAQTIGVPVCTAPGFDWSFNSAGQNPCAVSIGLAAICSSDVTNLPAVAPGLFYLGPNTTQVTPCRCSSVFYSTLSACAACQGAEFLPWSTFNMNCSTVSVASFPESIPSSLKVPGWAFLNIAPANTFSVSAAFTEATKSKGPNTKAIAGGVVGGILVLALLVGFWLFRRRNLARARLSQSSATNNPVQANSMSYTGNTTTSNDPTQGGISMSYAGSTFAASIPPKLYDPNDPSTFPTMGGFNSPSSYTPTPLPASTLPQQSPPTPTQFSGATPNATSPPTRLAYSGTAEAM